MNEAFLPIRSETNPAGTAVRAVATNPIVRRRAHKFDVEAECEQIEVE
jgi:hypothetical protein